MTSGGTWLPCPPLQPSSSPCSKTLASKSGGLPLQMRPWRLRVPMQLRRRRR